MMYARAVAIFSIAFAAMACGDQIPTSQPAVLTSAIEWMTVKGVPAPASLSGTAVARSFDQGAPVPIADLDGRFPGARLLAAIYYPKPPTTLAADLSKQLSLLSDISATSLAPLLISGDASRANRISTAWIRDRLAPTSDDSIGVCVLWGAEATTAEASDSLSAPKLVLVLFKFQHPAAGTPSLTRIEFGEPAALAQ